MRLKVLVQIEAEFESTLYGTDLMQAAQNVKAMIPSQLGGTNMNCGYMGNAPKSAKITKLAATEVPDVVDAPAQHL